MNFIAIISLIKKLASIFKIFNTVKNVTDINTTEVKENVETVVEVVKEVVKPNTNTVDTQPVSDVPTTTEPVEEPYMYTPSNKCYDMIKKFEGFSSKPYKCPAGIPTIGYGSTFYENGTKVTMKDAPITEEKATELLKNVVNNFAQEVNKLIKVKVTQNQFDALVDFAYNLGIGNLGSSTLLKKVNASAFTEAADQFPRWNKAGGVILEGLTKRRNAERELFLS